VALQNYSEFSWTLNVYFQESSHWRFVYSCHANSDSVTSGLGARHIYFRYTAISDYHYVIGDNTIEQVDHENTGAAVVILSVGVRELEIILGVFTPPLA